MNKKYRIRETCVFGTKGDVVTHVMVGSAKSEKDTIVSSLETPDVFPEYFEEVKEGSWRAEKNEKYYYIDDGYIYGRLDGLRIEDNFRHKTHNYFKTEQEAQNKLDLINHIFSFPMPEKGESYYTLGGSLGDVWFDKNDCSSDALWVKPDYNAGTVMNKNTTEQDREERIRLLKLVYNTEAK